MTIEAWPTDDDMAEVCETGPAQTAALLAHGAQPGCGHTFGQHEYGLDLAPCGVPGCPCRDFK